MSLGQYALCVAYCCDKEVSGDYHIQQGSPKITYGYNCFCGNGFDCHGIFIQFPHKRLEKLSTAAVIITGRYREISLCISTKKCVLKLVCKVVKAHIKSLLYVFSSNHCPILNFQTPFDKKSGLSMVFVRYN